MRRRMITIILISGCMMFLATGCSKAQIIKQYDNVLQSIGEKSITKNRKLQGERKLGEDSYVGSYKADYESFSGEEIVFGGTGLSRDAGNKIKVSCKIEAENGTAKITFQSGMEDARGTYGDDRTAPCQQLSENRGERFYRDNRTGQRIGETEA